MINLLITGVFAGGTSFDYCSINYSSIVKEEVQNYFLEVFNGFGLAVSKNCPFYNLDKTTEQYKLKEYQ